jgi:hypothetical protein
VVLSCISLSLAACGSDDGGDDPKPNQAPALAGPASIALQQGRSAQATLDVQDPEGDPVTVTVAPPAGIEATVTVDLALDAYADYAATGSLPIPLTLADDQGATTEASIAADVAPIQWLETLSWTTDGPAAREHAAMVVDEAGKRIVMIGGSGYAPQGTALGDIWQFDLTSKTWTEITNATGDVPPPAGSRRVAQVPGQPTAYLFGGYGDNFVLFDDFYRVDVSGGGLAFKKLTNSTSPSPRGLHGFSYDSETNRFFTFGGISLSGVAGDLWMATLDGDTANWSNVTPAAVPQPRYGFFFGTDDASGRTFVFSGATGTGSVLAPADDIWALDMRAEPPSWTLVLDGTAPGAPPGRRNGCFVMDPKGPRLLVFGGTADAASTEPGLWAFDARPGKERWSMLALAGEPPLRSSGMAAYDPVNDRLWLGFGNDAAVYRDFSAIGY